METHRSKWDENAGTFVPVDDHASEDEAVQVAYVDEDPVERFEPEDASDEPLSASITTPDEDFGPDDDEDEGDDFGPLSSFKPVNRRHTRLSDIIYADKDGPLDLTRIAESLSNPFQNVDQGTRDDDRFFRQLTKGGDLDLPPQMLQKAQRIALILWRRNPRAFCMTELVKDFTVGDGIRYNAEDPKVKKVLDDFWEINEWDDKLEERVRALALLGEQLLPVFVNSKTGLVRVSSITPFRIVSIDTAEQNAEDLITVTISTLSIPEGSVEAAPLSTTEDNKRWTLVRVEDDLTLTDEKLEGTEGIAFFFAVNRISGATRGAPDLLSVADWLEGLDNFLHAVLERAEISQELVWDLTLDDLTQPEIRKHVNSFAKSLRSGGIIGHNQKMKIEIKVPEMGSMDADITSKMLLRQIQAGARMAGMFFGDSEDLTRASASELSIPVAKMIQGRQNFIRRMFRKMFKYQIQQAKKAGVLDKNASEVFQIDLPQVFLRDLSSVTRAAASLVASLEISVEKGWVKQAEARMLFRTVMEQVVRLSEDGQNFSQGEDPLTEPAALEPAEIEPDPVADNEDLAASLKNVYGPNRNGDDDSQPAKGRTPDRTSVGS